MKLTYFQVRGRAEPARLMMELAGLPYEYEGISMEVWMDPERKAPIADRTPLGQLPILEDGEFHLCHSLAINRYLARKLGLYGDTPEQTARVDEVAETADDILMKDMSLFHWNPEFNERRAEHREALGKKLERVDRYFERTAAGPEHWVLPGRFTMADVLMAYLLETTIPMHPGLLDGYPRLRRAMDAFFSADGVRQYVRSDRRPRTWTIHLAAFAGRPDQTHHFTD